MRGTAADEDFLRYELAFNRGGGWVVFAEGGEPVIDGILGLWDTALGLPTAPVFPDGSYQLRLRVVRQDYNYDEYFVNGLTVANEALNGTPSVTATLPLATPVAVTRGASDAGVIAPLPSLTPFPTPSPLPTVQQTGLGADVQRVRGQQSGLLAQLSSLTNPQRYSSAFWWGVRASFGLFVALGLYLLARTILRWIWRQLQRYLS